MPDAARSAVPSSPNGNASPDRKASTARATPALRRARTCYDHLAGVLGVAVTEALVSQQALIPGEDGFGLGPHADAVFAALEVDLAEQLHRRASRPLLRSCLDWTERRPHLAGRLGASLAGTMLENGWLVRNSSGRSVAITDPGRQHLQRALGLSFDNVPLV